MKKKVLVLALFVMVSLAHVWAGYTSVTLQPGFWILKDLEDGETSIDKSIGLSFGGATVGETSAFGIGYDVRVSTALPFEVNSFDDVYLGLGFGPRYRVGISQSFDIACSVDLYSQLMFGKSAIGGMVFIEAGADARYHISDSFALTVGVDIGYYLLNFSITDDGFVSQFVDASELMVLDIRPSLGIVFTR